jgi:hypothetical protein
MFGLRHRGWTHSEAIAYFVKGVARELYIAPTFFLKLHEVEVFRRKEKEGGAKSRKKLLNFTEKWLKHDNEESYFDFGICKLPDVSKNKEKLQILTIVFDDTLMFPCLLNDNYDKYIVNHFDCFMSEGPYGYIDGTFDVTVKKGNLE